MPVFEVIAVERPNKKDAEENGAMEKVVFGPKMVVARDDKSAAFTATIGNDELKKFDASRLEVYVRPF